MSLSQVDDHFALVPEPAGSRFRARLAEVGRISQAIIAMRRTPEAAAGVAWPEADRRELVECLDYCDGIHFEEKSSRFVFALEGIDSNLYLLSIAALPRGFDVFASSASLSFFRPEDDSTPSEPHYHGTADFVEHFAVGAPSAEQAYLEGLRRITGFIRTNQRRATAPGLAGSAIPTDLAPAGRPDRSSVPPSTATWDAGSFAYSVGLLGAAVLMASGAGPGWLGFAAAFVPASMLAAWAVAPHA